VTLRFLWAAQRDGRTYWYLRRKGLPLIRLPDAPHDSPEFLAAYAQALGQEPPPKVRAPKGSIDALIRAAQSSGDYRDASPAYRAILDRHFALISAQGGDALASDLRAAHIRADLSALTPGAAAGRLKAWRFLGRVGTDLDLLAEDPAAAVRPPRQQTTQGHETWTDDEVARFRARWPLGTPTRACFELVAWTGARIGDAAVMGPGMVGKDGVLSYRQAKTGGQAYVPWTGRLPDYALSIEPERAMLHQALTACAGHMTFLATAHGRTRSGKGLGTQIAYAAGQAGVDKSAHGLRKRRAIALAELGASTIQIASWTGHTTLKEVAHYTAQADRRRAVMGTEQDRNSEKLAPEVRNGK
jgi:integrase/recombinase XerD